MDSIIPSIGRGPLENDEQWEKRKNLISVHFSVFPSFWNYELTKTLSGMSFLRQLLSETLKYLASMDYCIDACNLPCVSVFSFYHLYSFYLSNIFKYVSDIIYRLYKHFSRKSKRKLSSCSNLHCCYNQLIHQVKWEKWNIFHTFLCYVVSPVGLSSIF